MQRAQVQHTLRIALTSKSRLFRRQGDWIAFGETAPEHPMFGVIYWGEWNLIILEGFHSKRYWLLTPTWMPPKHAQHTSRT